MNNWVVYNSQGLFLFRVQRYNKKMTCASAHAIFYKFYSFCGNFYHLLPLAFRSFLTDTGTGYAVQNAILFDQQLTDYNYKKYLIYANQKISPKSIYILCIYIVKARKLHLGASILW